MDFLRALTPSRLAIGAVAGTAALGMTVIASASAFSAPSSPSPVASPTTSSSAPATAAPESSPSPSASPITKPKKPKPASRTKKARNIPERPRDTFTGKRLVYDKALMTVWMMNK